jgi:hypothetical protein
MIPADDIETPPLVTSTGEAAIGTAVVRDDNILIIKAD